MGALILRALLSVLIVTGCVAGQFRWKCNAKDGKFTMTPCANCKKFYCWDGQIFSEEKGYTPPPAYVLEYWEAVRQRSAQIRAASRQHGRELEEMAAKAREENKRLNSERQASHKAYMDDLERRIAASRSSGGAPVRPGDPPVKAAPQTVVVAAADPATPAPVFVPCSREKVAQVQKGMDRAGVEGILGAPQSAVSIPEDDAFVETLSYTLVGGSTARIRIENGKVARVDVSQ